MLVAFPALAYSAPAPKTAEIALPGSAAPSSTVSLSPAPSSTANSAANSGTQKQEMPFTGWKQFSTGHFRFIYEDASKEIAEGSLRSQTMPGTGYCMHTTHRRK